MRRRSASVLLLAAMLLLGACAAQPPRAPVDDPKLLEQLGFLRESAVDRGTVEGRLGAPKAVFEGGRVVAYRVFERKGQLGQGTGGSGDRCFSLVIQYSEDSRVLRHALVPVSCAPPKAMW